MSSIYKGLLDNSLQAALSSIEIYNKPDFKYREQVFVILNVNAWELLLKAKILKDAGDNLTALYVSLPDGTYKCNRSGNPLTIDITKAISQLSLDKAIEENLKILIEIRDTVIHFYENKSLSYLVYTLSSASLKNYQSLMNIWFGRSLLDYNFYILPLAFAYNFKTLSLLDLEKEPDVVANLIKITDATQAGLSQSGEFHFVCEIATKLESVKKFIGEPDFSAVVDPNAEQTIVFKNQRPIDKYPLDYYQVISQVKKEKPSVKQNQIDKVIKEYELKDKPKYSAYNFRTKKQEENYRDNGSLPKGIVSIYNEDAVRFIIEHIEA
jgi:hypothetical protein